MIDLRQLRQFVAVAEELHFRKAAEKLHMTQPPLTQAMRSLEETLDVALFDRTKKKVALTSGGEALLDCARQLLRLAEDLPREVRSASNGRRGHLRLAFVSSVAYGRVPGWISGFRHLNPEVSLELHEATMDRQIVSLANDEIDAGFVMHAVGAAPIGLLSLQLLTEPFLIALPINHILAAKASVQFHDLASEPMVTSPRTVAPSVYDTLLSYYHLQGVTPQIVQEAIELQTIVSLVAAGMGVAWVPQVFARFPRPGVVYREVDDMNVLLETSLVWHKKEMPIFKRFLNHITGSPNFFPPIAIPL